MVTSARQLRPVGYLDDIAGVLDALWLDACKDKLEAYAGQEQAGGLHDAVLMAIGLLVAAQVRRNARLPTLIEKADLDSGFDRAWRDAVRVHLGRAGIVGRLWLMADSALAHDPFRIRVGPLVGELVLLQDYGLGQGRRGATQPVRGADVIPSG